MTTTTAKKQPYCYMLHNKLSSTTLSASSMNELVLLVNTHLDSHGFFTINMAKNMWARRSKLKGTPLLSRAYPHIHIERVETA